jgi:hypothetical protein
MLTPSYLEALDGHGLLGPISPVSPADADRAAVVTEALICDASFCVDTGYAATMNSLRSIAASQACDDVSPLGQALYLAHEIRARLEQRGIDLGQNCCFRRALAISSYLWQFHFRATFKIGVARIATRDMELHAWTEYQGHPIAAYLETAGVFEVVEEVTPQAESSRIPATESVT